MMMWNCSLLLCCDPLFEALQPTLAVLSMPLLDAMLGFSMQAQKTKQEREPSQEAQSF